MPTIEIPDKAPAWIYYGGDPTRSEAWLEWTKDQVLELQENWTKAEAHNKEVKSARLEIAKKAKDALDAIAPVIGKDKHWAKRILRDFHPTNGEPCKPNLTEVMVNGKRVPYYDSDRTLLALWQFARDLRKKDQEKETAAEQAYLKSIAVAVEKYPNIKWQEIKRDELFAIVNDLEKEAWANANYPVGTEMDFDQCDECSSWMVGDHRCSCGNRRVSLVVEGDFISGFYAYAEAY